MSIFCRPIITMTFFYLNFSYSYIKVKNIILQYFSYIHDEKRLTNKHILLGEKGYQGQGICQFSMKDLSLQYESYQELQSAVYYVQRRDILYTPDHYFRSVPRVGEGVGGGSVFYLSPITSFGNVFILTPKKLGPISIPNVSSGLI